MSANEIGLTIDVPLVTVGRQVHTVAALPAARLAAGPGGNIVRQRWAASAVDWASRADLPSVRNTAPV